MNKTALIVGHIAIDLRNNKEFLGGPPQYQLPILSHFGFEIDVITSCRKDHPFLKTPNVKVFNIPSNSNTVFAFEKQESDLSNEDDRKLILKSKAAEIINVEPYLKKMYDIIIISPIASEISKDTMKSILKYSKLSFFDIQGLARKIKEDGEITLDLDPVDLTWVLEHFDYVKASHSEIHKMEYHNPFHSKLIVTNSGKDISVHSEGQSKYFPSIPEVNILDDTGSGDIFIATFAATLIENNLEKSLSKADQIARMALKIDGVPSEDQVNLFFQKV